MVLDKMGNPIPNLETSITIRIVSKEDVDFAYNIYYAGKGDINNVTLQDINDSLCYTDDSSVAAKISKKSPKNIR